MPCALRQEALEATFVLLSIYVNVTHEGGRKEEKGL
jgi:hypothetical protein